MFRDEPEHGRNQSSVEPQKTDRQQVKPAAEPLQMLDLLAVGRSDRDELLALRQRQQHRSGHIRTERLKTLQGLRLALRPQSLRVLVNALINGFWITSPDLIATCKRIHDRLRTRRFRDGESSI